MLARTWKAVFCGTTESEKTTVGETRNSQDDCKKKARKRLPTKKSGTKKKEENAGQVKRLKRYISILHD